MVALSTQMSYIHSSNSFGMKSDPKIRVQGLLDPDVAKLVQERACKGRRPVSREVAYLIDLGLKAENVSQLSA